MVPNRTGMCSLTAAGRTTFLVIAFVSSILRLPAAPKATQDALPQIRFSVPRGFCDSPIRVELVSPIKETSIRYTLDGSQPTETRGASYAGPLLITNTTLLRAAAFQNAKRVSAVSTHSYIFLDQVLKQSAAPRGLPSGAGAW